MEQLVKIVIIGDSGVGKSSMLLRFVENKYDDFFLPTIGLEFFIKKININNKIYKIHIWDLAGQDRCRSLVTSYYRNAQGILLAFDLTNQDSFKNIEKWISNIYKYGRNNVKIILVGTKSDLEQDIKVSAEQIEKFAQYINVSYYEISAKNNSNIEESFEDLVKQIQLNLDIEKDLNNKYVSLSSKKNTTCCK